MSADEDELEDGPEVPEPDPEAYVGYKHPPKHSRWPKGYCPNRAGRPRKRKSRRAYLQNVAYRTIEARDGSRVRTMTVLEAIIVLTKAKALAGHVGATRQFEKLLGLNVVDAEPAVPKSVLITPERLTEEEWEARFGPTIIEGQTGPLSQ